MEMVLGITIEKIVSKLTLTTRRPDNILGFGELWFFELNKSEPLFKVKGLTVRERTFNGKKVLTVNFPAFSSSRRFFTSFIIENKSLYGDAVNLFLKEYTYQSGEPVSDVGSGGEKINPDEIPI